MKRVLAIPMVFAVSTAFAVLTPPAASATGPVVASLSASTSLPPLRAGDWLMYRDRDAHGGWNGSETLLSTSTAGSLVPIFAFPAAGAFIPEQLGAVGHGLLFAQGAGGGLSAFDAATGQVRWTAPSAGTEVALGGDVVYTVTAAGTIVVLDAATGRSRWQLTVPGDWVSFYGQALRPPTLVNGCLLVSGIQSYPVSPTVTWRRSVVDCFSVATRSLRWSTVVAAPDSTIGAPSADSRGVFVATDGHTVTALSLTTGAIRWQTASAVGSETSTPMPSPVVRGDRVMVGFAGGSFRAFNISTGQQVWSQQACPASPSAIFATAASANGVDYVTCENYSNTVAADLVAVSEADGHIIWSVRSNEDNSPPTVANGVVYVGTTATGSNGLAAYGAANGILLGSWTVRGPGGHYDSVTEPIVSHGRVYIGTATASTAFGLP